MDFIFHTSIDKLFKVWCNIVTTLSNSMTYPFAALFLERKKCFPHKHMLIFVVRPANQSLVCQIFQDKRSSRHCQYYKILSSYCNDSSIFHIFFLSCWKMKYFYLKDFYQMLVDVISFNSQVARNQWNHCYVLSHVQLSHPHTFHLSITWMADLWYACPMWYAR